MRTRLSLFCCLLAICLPVAAEEGYGPFIANGLDENLAIGADLFFSETFDGNGRTCATCHEVANNYTLPLDLTRVSESSSLMVGDPDNLDFVPGLELCDQFPGSENCQAIRQNGLILVNADEDNLGPDGARSYSMRSIPHVLSMATTLTPPAGGAEQATGWSGDGSPDMGGLRDFATGAVRQHFTLDTDRDPELGHFREPTESELIAMEAFQLELGRTRDIPLGSVTFRDGSAVTGATLFAARCAPCHANAGADRNGVNQNFNTHVEELRIETCPSLPGDLDPGKCASESAALVLGANFDGGFDVVDVLGDGRWGDGTFNTPPLIEAADTAPFFHDNRNDSLEGAIAFYRTPTFLDSPSCNVVGNPCGLEGTAAGLPETRIGAMLRILNAGFNISMAAQRLHTAVELMTTEPGTDPSVIKVLRLARQELADAKAVISPKPLGIFVVFEDTGGHIFNAQRELNQAMTSLDGQIANGTSGLQLAILMADVIAIADDRLSPTFYDESEERCDDRGVVVSQGQYHDCRWLYELGEANVLFDNNGVAPSIVDGETELTWTPNPGGTATLTMTWRTAEWSNPLFDETRLIDLSRNPAFDPITFTGSVTQLANGQFERSYSHTIPCAPNAKYRMEVTARVGGVTETDSDQAKAPRFCIGF